MKRALTYVAIGIATVAVLVGGWFGYWAIAKAGQTARYDVNVNNQQYQAGLIARQRDRVTDYDRSQDDAQRQAIADQFCAEYDTLNPPPVDLVRAHAHLCPQE